MKFKLFLAAIILFFILGIRYCYHRADNSNHLKRKIVISTMVVKNGSWQPTIQALGNVKASKSIDISSEVPGIVENLHFDSGQSVSEGQLLVELRADSIKSDLAKAQATLTNDVSNYKRRKALLPSHYISEADVGNFLAVVEEHKADVKREQALLAQHAIVAPFAGVVGIRKVEVGQYLSSGQAIVNLESIDPVYVDFSIPEKWISRIRVGESVTIASVSYPGESFSGKVIATENAVDMANRSLMVRVTVPNPQKKLLTGMAVNVTLEEEAQQKLILPQSALAYNPEGTGVYVIDKNNIAHWRSVIVSERKNNDAVVSSGININDVVVVAGQQKLHEGLEVTTNNKDNIIG